MDGKAAESAKTVGAPGADAKAPHVSEKHVVLERVDWHAMAKAIYIESLRTIKLASNPTGLSYSSRVFQQIMCSIVGILGIAPIGACAAMSTAYFEAHTVVDTAYVEGVKQALHTCYAIDISQTDAEAIVIEHACGQNKYLLGTTKHMLPISDFECASPDTKAKQFHMIVEQHVNAAYIKATENFIEFGKSRL